MIFSAEEVYPNFPETTTRSPALPPFRLGILFESISVNPIMLQSITNSLDSLVSPPTMSTLYSLETLLNPKSKLCKLFSEYFLGIPTEIRHAYGFTPFAAKSLTHAITLFLAICQGCIKEGTSVLSTNMSHFKMRFMQD